MPGQMVLTRMLALLAASTRQRASLRAQERWVGCDLRAQAAGEEVGSVDRCGVSFCLRPRTLNSLPALDTPYDTLPICLCRIKPAILAITITDLRSDLRRRGTNLTVVK